MISFQTGSIALAAVLVGAELWQASAMETLPTTALVAEAAIPFVPSDSLKHAHDGVLAFGFGSLWMVNHPNLMRIDPATNLVSLIELTGIKGPVRYLGIGEGAVWIADNATDTIFKVDPATNAVVGRFHAPIETRDSLIGLGGGSLWIVTADNFDRTLTRLNAESGTVEAQIDLPASSSPGVVFDFNSAWVIGSGRSQLYRVDPDTNTIVSATDLDSFPSAAVSAEGSLWIHSAARGTIERIDPVSGKVIASIETHAVGIDCLAAGGGYVWLMVNPLTVLQIDPQTNTVVRKFTGSAIGDVQLWGPMLSYGADSLWILGKLDIVRVKPPG